MRTAARATALGLGALHAVWATGASFPFGSREQLAHAVIGRDEVPGPAWCLAVSAGLATTALATPTLLALAFALRGTIGLLKPELLPAGEHPEFARLNARVYSPGCLMLAAALAMPRRTSSALRA